ncbi:MAG: hypothetical protein ACK2T7_01825 [Anaerolineales bacterium]
MEINDVIVLNVESKSNQITILKESDPLLRRFGQCDLINLESGESIEIWRQQADEVWFVFEELASFELVDLRENSPSFEVQQTFILRAETPQVILIPFGVSCRISTDISLGSRLVRLTTHQDGTLPGDKTP